MDVSSMLSKAASWLKWAIPFAIGLAVAVVMRQRPAAPQEQPAKGPDMTPADNNAKELEKEQHVLADQHAAIEDTLKPRPVVIQADKSLLDAVNEYNKDK